MAKEINNKVKELRQAKGGTQEDLAQAVGVTRQTVIALEKGDYTPSVYLAIKLAEYFEVSVEEIFSIKS